MRFNSRRTPVRIFVESVGKVGKRLGGMSKALVARFEEVPLPVRQHNLVISLLCAGGFLSFWVCQNDFFEGHVADQTILKAQEEFVSKVQRVSELRCRREGDWKAIDSLQLMIPKVPASDTAGQVLAAWLGSLGDETRAGFSRADTLQLRGITNRLLGLLAGKVKRDGSVGRKLSRMGSSTRVKDWLPSVFSGCALSLLLGVLVFLVTHCLQASAKFSKRVSNGEYYPNPILFCVFLLTCSSYFILFLALWGRDVSDVYWVWALPYAIVLAAVAGAKNAPVLEEERALVDSALDKPSNTASERRVLAWLTSRMEQDRTIQGWVLIIAFALGFSLLFGAMQSQGERMTRDGLARYSFEFAVLSVYIWLVGIFGGFFRYGNRVKEMQRLLAGWSRGGH